MITETIDYVLRKVFFLPNVKCYMDIKLTTIKFLYVTLKEDNDLLSNAMCISN